MRQWFLAAGIALILFSLWAVLRHDWLRLTRSRRRVIGEVVGHRTSWENAARSFAAIYAFSDEAGRHEVEDAVHSSFARPEVGTRVELAYPEGRPDLARPPRPLLWVAIYLCLAAMLALLAATALGWVD